MPRSPRFSLIVCFLTSVCGAFRAQAQTIVVQQNQLVFNAQPGTISPVVSFPIAYSAGGGTFSVAFSNLTGGGNWLTLSQTSGSLPATLLLSANAGTLAPGVYTGIFTITVPGAVNSPFSLPVYFNVGVNGTGLLSTNIPSLQFNGAVNGAPPPTQQIALSTIAPGLGFLGSVTTFSGGNWLQINPGSGNAPAFITVGVLTAGLSAGFYQGLITFTPAGAAPVLIPVTLNLMGNATVTASANLLQFFYQTGFATPPSQQLSFTTNDGSRIAFQATATTNDGGNWLVLTQNSGTTPQTITVAASVNGFAPGAYTGNIAIFAAGAANPTINVPVTLTISNSNLLTLGTPPSPFNFQSGSPLPGSQTVSIGSTSAPLNYTVSVQTPSGTGAWLVAGPAAGTTTSNLAVGVNPLNLAAGSYTGTVTITAPGAANSPQSFNVVLNVNISSVLAVSPPALTFVYQAGSTVSVPSRPLTINTTAASAATLVATTSSCGPGWLQLSQTTISTPGSVLVTVNPTGIVSPQVCNGSISVSANGVTAASVIPVTFILSNTHLLNIVQTSLSFSAPYQGTLTDPQTIQMTSTDSNPVTYFTTTTTSNGGSWISAGPTAATTPTPITVSANPNGLSPGTYNGAVVINAGGFPAPQTVPVTFTVAAATNTVAIPSALSFTQTLGGSAPAPQTVTINTANGAFSFSATPSTTNLFPWLQVSPPTGTTPGVITVSVNGNGLTPGIYNGTIGISVPGSANDPLVIPVTLTMAAARGISSNVASLSFAYEIGNINNPVSQPLGISSTGGAVSFSPFASTNNSGNWLSVSPSTATTPASLSVSVNPSGLTPGTYTGQITISVPGVIGSPLITPVQLVVTPPSAPAITSAANAASGAAGAVSPGAIITLKGTAMGPGVAASFKVNASGGVDTTLGGSTVLIDGFAAPLLYASQTQINAIVPYEIANRQAVTVEVLYQGRRSPAASVNVLAASPGIFTANASGTGQGAILNQDSTPNSSANPATAGSVIQVFATGEGVTKPPSFTGSITGSQLRQPVLPVTATIGGVPADVVFAGSAPQSVAGLLQVNLRVPDGVGSGPAPVVITIGNQPSQSGVTVALQ